MGRVGTGLTAATLPLVIALSFAEAGCVIPAVLFFLLAAAVVVGTFAPYLPVLHKLPAIGAPRLTAGFTVNGSPDLGVTLAKPKPGITGTQRNPHALLIRVGVTSHSRADVEHALLNFAFPLGHSLKACDHHGLPVDRGKAMPPTQEIPPFDYWAIDELRFTGRNGHLFHFRARVSSPGEYPMVLRIQSKDLYEELVVRETLRVDETDEDALSLRDNLGRIIDEGEAIRESTPEGLAGNQLQHSVSAFYYVALETVRKAGHEIFAERLKNAELDYTGPQVGDDYLRAYVAAKVRVLYEIRDQLPVVES